MRSLRPFLMIAALIFAIQCSESGDHGSDPVDPKPPELGAVKSEMIQADNRFGLKLFQKLAENDPDDNIFISPVSIATALAMAANGADGKTLDEINQVLGYNDLDQDQINQAFKDMTNYLVNRDPDVATQLANSIWYDTRYTFSEKFLNTNRDYFDAYVKGLLFSNDASADTINGWVDDKTRGLINEVIEKPIDPELVMFLINAIYFKGSWTYQFADTATVDRKFHNQDGTKSDVKMMQGDLALDYHWNQERTLARLPYGNDRYSMILIMPGWEKDIDWLIDELSSETLTEWLGQMHEDTIKVGLPRFKMKYDKELNKALKSLGMNEPFIPFVADFTPIRPENDLFISFVKHKSFIEVNEEGTEAAAVTVVGFGATSIGDPKAFYADHPFLFLIQDDESGIILFIGKVGELPGDAS